MHKIFVRPLSCLVILAFLLPAPTAQAHPISTPLQSESPIIPSQAGNFDNSYPAALAPLPSERSSPTELAIGSTTLFYDDFSGDLSKWSDQIGDWSITENDELHGWGWGGNIDGWNYAGDPTWTDYSFQTKVFFDECNAELVVRSTGHWQNEYRITFYDGSSGCPYPNVIGIYKYQNGVGSSLFNGDIPSPVPNPSTIRVDVIGNSISVYMNSQLITTFTDSDPLTSGRIGLGVIWNYQNRFDDVLVTRIDSGDDLSIMDIEINQALGVQKDNEQKFMAGKPTVIRVLLNQSVSVDPSTQRLQVTRDGTVQTTLVPQSKPGSTTSLDFYCPKSDNACGYWPAGNYTFTATVAASSNTTTATFVNTTQSLRFLFVPIKVKDGWFNTKLADTKYLTFALEFLRKTYPIDPKLVEWKIDSELDATSLDLGDDGDQRSLIMQLSGRNPPYCSRSSSPNCYDHVIGFLPLMNLNYKGYAFPDVDNAAVVMVNGVYTESVTRMITTMEQTVAHEIGHNYEMGEEYDFTKAFYACTINPPPPSFGNSACPESKAIKWPGTASGVLISSMKSHPFEVGGRGLLPDSVGFMGTGGNMSEFWISPDEYSHLFTEFTKSTAVQNLAMVETRLIQVRAAINLLDDSVQIYPWIAFTGQEPAINSGAYTIEALDVANNVLAIQHFDVSQYDMSNPPQPITISPFIVDMSYPEGTVRFQIKHGETVIAEKIVESIPPTVTITSPNGGEVWTADQIQSVSWTATGTAPLTFTVLFTADSLSWQVLATDLAGTTFGFDPSLLPGGDKAMIRVIANDGVNLADDFSDKVFSVSKKGPITSILSPLEGGVIPNGLAFFMNACAYDVEDLELPSESITWSSNKDGALGNGSSLMVNLSYGGHVLTMTAADGDGNTVQKNVSIFVGSKVYLPMVIR